MEPNIITLTDQYGESVRFELLDIIEYEDQEFAVLYPAMNLFISCESLLKIWIWMKWNSKVWTTRISSMPYLICSVNAMILNKYCNYSVTAVKELNSVAGHRVNSY